LFNSFGREAAHKRGLSNKQDDEHSISYLRDNIAFIISKRGKADVAAVIPFLKDENADVRSLALRSLSGKALMLG
jgi:HEAT repeat protein